MATLDTKHVRALWERMIAVEKGRQSYLSANEARACRKLAEIHGFLDRYVPDVNADIWPIRVRQPTIV